MTHINWLIDNKRSVDDDFGWVLFYFKLLILNCLLQRGCDYESFKGKFLHSVFLLFEWY